ncbi:MAG TPA: hypothetical protein VGH77_09025 [Streptosporangiaceae bacterium]
MTKSPIEHAARRAREQAEREHEAQRARFAAAREATRAPEIEAEAG